MLLLLSTQRSFLTRTLLHVSMCRATEYRLEGTDFPRPRPDEVTNEHAWLLRSVTDPPHAGRAGHRKGSGLWEQDGRQVGRAFFPRLTLQLQQLYLSVCQWEDGSQDCERRLIIFMVSSHRGQKLWLLLFIPFGTLEPWENELSLQFIVLGLNRLKGKRWKTQRETLGDIKER